MADRLSTDLLLDIGYRLDTAADLIRFLAVSKSWRSALRQPPWLLMLSKSQNLIELVGAGEQSICQDLLQIPGASRVVGSSGKWLIIEVHDRSIRLLNPFSGLQFHLPSLFRFQTEAQFEVKDASVRKIVLSSAPPRNGGDTNFIAAAALRNLSKLAIVKPGDASWTTVASYPNMSNTYFDDVIFYKGRFYAVSTEGGIAVCNIWDDALKLPELSFIMDCFIEKTPGARKCYLAEWMGELLLVVRFLRSEYECYENQDEYYVGLRYKTNNFKTYKLNSVSMKFEELNCLGDHSLFLGFNTSVSVEASNYFGLVRMNCIYFTDDWVNFNADNNVLGEIHTANDTGVFDLEDNSVTLHYRRTSTFRSVCIIPSED